MARVKRGVTSHAKHKKVLKAVKGQWHNDNKMISVEPDTTEYYIPESVKILTLDQLKARQVAIHAVTPFMKWEPGIPGQEAGDVMTDAEVETMVADWAAAQ